MARTLIHVPRSARRGEIIEIRTLIAHPMETGYRPGSDGKILPRDLIRSFSCDYLWGTQADRVFGAELFPAIAANPYLVFSMRAVASGRLRFEWKGDQGFEQMEVVDFQVTD